MKFINISTMLSVIMTGTNFSAEAKNDFGGYDDWRAFARGATAECGKGKVIAGLCVSPGSDKTQCDVNGKKHFGAMICADIPEAGFSWIDENPQSATIIAAKGNDGRWASCPDNYVATAVKVYGGNTYLTCNPINGAVSFDERDRVTLCNNTPSRKLTCDEGYVLTEACNSYDTRSGSGCNTSSRDGTGCQWRSDNSVQGYVCTRLEGYAFTGVQTEATLVKDEDYQFLDVEACKKEPIFAQGEGFTHEYTNSVKYFQQMQQDFSDSTTTKNSLTHQLNVENKLTTKGGVPFGKVKNELTTGYGLTVESELVRNEQYATSQLEGNEVDDTIKRTIEFQKGHEYALLSWKMSVHTSAKYVPEYKIYSPGSDNMSYRTTSEDVVMRNAQLDPTEFFMILSDEQFSTTYLRQRTCEEIAADFMNLDGPFAIQNNDQIHDEVGALEFVSTTGEDDDNHDSDNDKRGLRGSNTKSMD